MNLLLQSYFHIITCLSQFVEKFYFSTPKALLFRMYQMLHTLRLSTTMGRWIDYGPPRWVDCWSRYRSIGVKCLSRGRNDTLPS